MPEQPNWLYVQKTGALYRTDGSFCAQCYSGHGDGINNPKLQAVKNVGPIPANLYEIGRVDEAKGPLTIHLVPVSGSDMLGRDYLSFLIHGDNHLMNHTGSEGCIVAPPAARAEVASSGGFLRVICQPAQSEIVT